MSIILQARQQQTEKPVLVASTGTMPAGQEEGAAALRRCRRQGAKVLRSASNKRLMHKERTGMHARGLGLRHNKSCPDTRTPCSSLRAGKHLDGRPNQATGPTHQMHCCPWNTVP